jgi:hypothetical protein
MYVFEAEIAVNYTAISTSPTTGEEREEVSTLGRRKEDR